MTELVHGGATRTVGPRRRIVIWAGLAALLVAAVAPQPLSAQRTEDERRRALVDELLRSLIESELEKRGTEPSAPSFDAAPAPRTTAPAPRSNTAPAPRTTPPATRTNVAPTPRVVSSPTREMTEARRVLADLQRDADQLTTLLNTDVTRVPGIRPYLGDVLRLRARAAVLNQRSAQLNDHRELLPDLQNLDRDWRVLAYRLRAIRGLDPRGVQLIDRLDGYAEALSTAFNMQPQVDHRTLLQKAAALSGELHGLIEDIEIELSQSTERHGLLLDGRRIEQQAISLTNTIADEAQYDVISEEFTKFETLWTPFTARLRPLGNRYLERDARRVEEINIEIHTLLWMPQDLDRSQVLHLAELLKKDMDDFYARAPLRLLIELPENERVLPAADQFFGVCENFIRNVENGEELGSIIEDYGYIEASWQEFDRLLRPVNSRAAQQVLQTIQERMQAIRTALNMQDGFDRSISIDLAASLDNLAEHLQQDMGHWLSYTPANFRNEAMRDASEFATAAHQLHVDVLNGADARSVRQSSDGLHDRWRKVHQWVGQCQTEDRIHLQRISSHITTALVDLRTQVQ